MAFFGMLKSREEREEIKRREEAEKRRAKAERDAQIKQLLEQGRLLEEQGRDEDALNAYEDAAQDAPQAALAFAEIAKKLGRWRRLYSCCVECEKKIFENADFAPILKFLAECYREGHGTEKDLKKAYKTMKRYQSQMKLNNDGPTQMFLGLCARDIETDIDLHKSSTSVMETNKSIKWSLTADDHFRNAAKAGYVPAMLELARNPDGQIAFEYMNMAIDAGSHEAAVEFFWRFIHAGQQHFPPSESSLKTMAKRLKEGAAAGNPDCMFAAALCYADGFIGSYGFNYRHAIKSPLNPDPDKFFYWLSMAYNAGSSDPGVLVMAAQYFAMGKIWKDHRYQDKPIYSQADAPIDQRGAFAILLPVHTALKERMKAPVWDSRARHWYMASRYLMAKLYLDGRGTKADIKKAIECINAVSHTEKTVTVAGGEYAILMALDRELSQAQCVWPPVEYTIERDED